jgi:acyl carrier protein
MNEEYPIPTAEERAADRRALMEKCPTAGDRFKLMFGKCNILDSVKEILEENAFIQDGEALDPNTAFQELNMDSLDITRFVIEVSQRLGVELDIENVWPTTVGELTNQIKNQIR